MEIIDPRYTRTTSDDANFGTERVVARLYRTLDSSRNEHDCIIVDLNASELTMDFEAASPSRTSSVAVAEQTSAQLRTVYANCCEASPR